MRFSELKTAAGRAVNYSFQVERGVHRLTVPVVAGVGRANRDAHEEHLFRVLEKLHAIGAADLLVDIGVNIGQTLIKYALITDGAGRYIGFEPNIRAASYVEEIIRINDLNGQVVPVALGSGRRLTSLFLQAQGSTDPGASINEQFRDSDFYHAHKLVPVFEADDALQALGMTERGFTVKIDTEGSELEVVRGMERTLRDQRPFVIMEILPPSFSDAVQRFRLAQAVELKITMVGMGFKMARIGVAGELHWGDATERPVTHDYLFVPTERASELR